MDTMIRFCDDTKQKEIFLRNSESAQDILKKFHALGKPALCLCNEDGQIKLSIKKRTKYFLAAYPNTGPLHHFACTHYQKPEDILSGANQLSENARKELNGKIYISCKVGLTRREEKEMLPTDDEIPEKTEEEEVIEKEKARTALRRVALTDVALEFWLGAQLNQWMPSFKGLRYWGSIRRRLSSFTANVYINKLPMSKLLYIPPVYTEELKQEIAQSKSKFFAQWQGKNNKDFLVIGELRTIDPTEHGFSLKLVHENYQFFMSPALHKTLQTKYSFELSVHESNQSIEGKQTGRVLVIMSCNMPTKYITVRSISLIGLSNEYIPVLNKYELQLADKLVKEDRTFSRPAKAKCEEHNVADFVFLDTEKETVVGIFDDYQEDYDEYLLEKEAGLENLGYPIWKWYPSQESNIPELPSLSSKEE